jgi:hypothetical protein
VEEGKREPTGQWDVEIGGFFDCYGWLQYDRNCGTSRQQPNAMPMLEQIVVPLVATPVLILLFFFSTGDAQNGSCRLG